MLWSTSEWLHGITASAWRSGHPPPLTWMGSRPNQTPQQGEQGPPGLQPKQSYHLSTQLRGENPCDGDPEPGQADADADDDDDEN